MTKRSVPFAVRPLSAAAAGLVLGVLAVLYGGTAWAVPALACGLAALVCGAVMGWKNLVWCGAFLLVGTARAALPACTVPEGLSLRFTALAETIGTRIDALFPDWPGVARGMLLGAKNAAVDPALKEQLYAVGIGHLLAVSGLHVSVLAGCILKVWRRGARVPRFLVLAAFLAAYCLLTGMAPSVLRAAVMLLYTVPVAEIPRRRDRMVSLSLAVIVVLLWKPASVGTAGFLLSFTAAGGILLLAGPLGEDLRMLPGMLRSGLSVSLAAVLGTLPVTVAFFGEFSALGILANLVILPLAPFFLIPAFLVTVLSFAWYPAAAALAAFPRGVLWLMMTLANAGGGAVLRLAAPGPAACAFYYAALLFLSDLCRLGKKTRRLAALGLAVAAAALWAAGA